MRSRVTGAGLDAWYTQVIRIVVVDDHPTVRAALHLRLALEPDLTVIGQAQNGLEALKVVAEIHPDVVLMDLEMPGMDGLTATSLLRESVPNSAVVMVSMHDDATTRSKAQAAGAIAFLSKHEAVTEILPATIRAAALRGPGAAYGNRVSPSS